MNNSIHSIFNQYLNGKVLTKKNQSILSESPNYFDFNDEQNREIAKLYSRASQESMNNGQPIDIEQFKKFGFKNEEELDNYFNPKPTQPTLGEHYDKMLADQRGYNVTNPEEFYKMAGEDLNYYMNTGGASGPIDMEKYRKIGFTGNQDQLKDAYERMTNEKFQQTREEDYKLLKARDEADNKTNDDTMRNRELEDAYDAKRVSEITRKDLINKHGPNSTGIESSNDPETAPLTNVNNGHLQPESSNDPETAPLTNVNNDQSRTSSPDSSISNSENNQTSFSSDNPSTTPTIGDNNSTSNDYSPWAVAGGLAGATALAGGLGYLWKKRKAAQEAAKKKIINK